MPDVDRHRSLLASVVGWVLVVVIAIVALRFVVGTFMWVLRGALLIALVLGLLWAYLWLKAPRGDGPDR
jgi:hypothetical protein